jgi:hypothetical protein
MFLYFGVIDGYAIKRPLNVTLVLFTLVSGYQDCAVIPCEYLFRCSRCLCQVTALTCRHTKHEASEITQYFGEL